MRRPFEAGPSDQEAEENRQDYHRTVAPGMEIAHVGIVQFVQGAV